MSIRKMAQSKFTYKYKEIFNQFLLNQLFYKEIYIILDNIAIYLREFYQ